jgi:ornithine cyclodeaminase/alanine dehydrogenase-like protein (mu-crystallin family)
MPALIKAVGHAFDKLGPPGGRIVLPAGGQDWVIMPGLTSRGGMLCKLLRVGHGDGTSSTGVPTISGIVALLDAGGALLALLDGGTLTARRTAAVAAYASSLLAADGADILTVFGAGSLAEEHVEAIAAVRPLREIRAVGRSPERAREFSERMAGRGFDVSLSDPEDALDGANIIVTATTSGQPVLTDELVEPGTHINAMGSYKPERAEIPGATVARARVVVETRESAWHEAGDLIQPRNAGLIGDDHVLAEIHEHERILAIRSAEPDAVTLFKSVGHVALDLAALEVALGQLDRTPA